MVNSPSQAKATMLFLVAVKFDVAVLETFMLKYKQFFNIVDKV